MCSGLSSCPAWCGSHHKSSVGHCRLLLLLRRTTQKPGFRPMMTTMAVMTRMMMIMTAMMKMTPLFTARMAESQMMGRTPFYSPLHSMVSSYDDFYDDHDSNDVFLSEITSICSGLGSSLWSSCLRGKSNYNQGHHLHLTNFSDTIVVIATTIKKRCIICLITQSGYPGFGYPPTPPKESPGGVDPSTPSPMPGQSFLGYHNDRLFRVIFLSSIMITLIYCSKPSNTSKWLRGRGGDTQPTPSCELLSTQSIPLSSTPSPSPPPQLSQLSPP